MQGEWLQFFFLKLVNVFMVNGKEPLSLFRYTRAILKPYLYIFESDPLLLHIVSLVNSLFISPFSLKSEGKLTKHIETAHETQNKET